MTTDFYTLETTGDIHTVEYAIFNGPTLASVKQQIRHNSLVQFAIDTFNLECCPFNYVSDNLWSVIQEYVNFNLK